MGTVFFKAPTDARPDPKAECGVCMPDIGNVGAPGNGGTGAAAKDIVVHTNDRREVLETAIKTVCKDRQDQYGHPENNFQTIADLWNTYLNAAGVVSENGACEIRPHDVAAMMCMLKLARIATGTAKLDNWVDLAGYAALGGEVEK